MQRWMEAYRSGLQTRDAQPEIQVTKYKSHGRITEQAFDG